jgi:hypothetical protein
MTIPMAPGNEYSPAFGFTKLPLSQDHRTYVLNYFSESFNVCWHRIMTATSLPLQPR